MLLCTVKKLTIHLNKNEFQSGKLLLAAAKIFVQYAIRAACLRV